jgi:hypothetical protein
VSIPRSSLEKYLGKIVGEIDKSPNRARYAMNNAMISIGVFSPGMREDAIKAAIEVGRVDVDHGETYCKTPDAKSYIERAHARKGRSAKNA